MYKMQVRFVIF